MSTRKSGYTGAGVRRRCPICGRPADPGYRPFCSKRCADIDLGRWLGEAYRIPAEDEPEPEGDSGEDIG